MDTKTPIILGLVGLAGYLVYQEYVASQAAAAKAQLIKPIVIPSTLFIPSNSLDALMAPEGSNIGYVPSYTGTTPTGINQVAPYYPGTGMVTGSDPALDAEIGNWMPIM